MINLSISQMAYKNIDNEYVLNEMYNRGFSGMEILPTMIAYESPYEKIDEAIRWRKKNLDSRGIKICSMQSIWYGKRENIFSSVADRQTLIDYTEKAISFASALGCGNLVFGCPINRTMQEKTLSNYGIAVDFFKRIGDYAKQWGCVIAIEANPTIYNTNFINTTREAYELVKDCDSEGIRINLDLGTIIANDENIKEICCFLDYVNHVHISEPGLGVIKKRVEHRQIIDALKDYGYDKYVSIEMKSAGNIDVLIDCMEYIIDITL